MAVEAKVIPCHLVHVLVVLSKETLHIVLSTTLLVSILLLVIVVIVHLICLHLHTAKGDSSISLKVELSSLISHVIERVTSSTPCKLVIAITTLIKLEAEFS